MSLILSREEIALITGRKQRSKQLAQLARMSIPYELDALGNPVVFRDWVSSMSSNETISRQTLSARTSFMKRLEAGEF